MKSEVFRIDALAYGGDGVGRSGDGAVCFISGALPGELVEAEITAVKKRFRRGRLLRVIEASDARIEPECPYFASGTCPGCVYIHCTYEHEILWKQRQLHDFLVRRGVLNPEALLEPFAVPQRFGLRNKLVMHSADGIRGYIGKDNQTLFQVDKCLLAAPEINELLAATAPAGGREVFRFTVVDGALKVSTGCDDLLTETLPPYGEFQVAPTGFFQTNPVVGSELIRRVIEVVRHGGLPRLVELYCGVGIFSIAAAEALPQLQTAGVELDAGAIGAAKHNAANHQVASRCRFAAGDAGKLLRQEGLLHDAVLLVDPPRSGLSRDAVAAILRVEPAILIYISCAADTLVRDLEWLKAGNYTAESAGLLDMFPGTAHFEVMTVLRRGEL